MGMENSRDHDNNFGFLRLLFACLVIVSHAPEMVDGGTGREPLVLVFGTLTFGELAVDGFFLISGYLVTRSYLTSSSLKSYAAKRILRIYPAFLVAYLLSLLVIGPLVGGRLEALDAGGWFDALTRMLMLAPAWLPGVFPDQHLHFLNGAMWTISYEFRCYVLTALLGMAGLYRHRLAFLVYLAALFLLNLALLHHVITPEMLKATENHTYRNIFLDPLHMPRFLLVFSCGSAFFLFREYIVYRADIALFSLLASIAMMYVPELSEIGLCTFGAYFMFWTAFRLPGIPVNQTCDISYGVYLYGWPITGILITQMGNVPLHQLTVTAIVLSMIAGAASWFGIEKRALALKSRFGD